MFIKDKEHHQPKKWRSGNSQISVGCFTYGYKKLHIHEWGEGAALNIGKFCSIASNVSIFLGGNHRIDWISTYPFGHVYRDALNCRPAAGHPSTKGDVIIGNDVWIGSGTTILSGVTIGDGAVLTANANVVTDVAPYEIVGGNPSKILKKRFDDETISLLLQLRWWDLEIDEIKEIANELCAPPSIEAIRSLVDRFRGQIQSHK